MFEPTKSYNTTVAKKTPVVRAVKTSAVAAKPAAKKPAAPKKAALTVTIDYPLEGEAIHPGHYSIRITAAGAGQAQARIAGGDWLDCREAVGHFWLDWSPASGPVLLEARARAGKARWTSAASRRCVVAG